MIILARSRGLLLARVWNYNKRSTDGWTPIHQQKDRKDAHQSGLFWPHWYCSSKCLCSSKYCIRRRKRRRRQRRMGCAAICQRKITKVFQNLQIFLLWPHCVGNNEITEQTNNTDTAQSIWQKMLWNNFECTSSLLWSLPLENLTTNLCLFQIRQ